MLPVGQAECGTLPEITPLLGFFPCFICFLGSFISFCWEHFLNKSLPIKSLAQTASETSLPTILSKCTHMQLILKVIVLSKYIRETNLASKPSVYNLCFHLRKSFIPSLVKKTETWRGLWRIGDIERLQRPVYLMPMAIIALRFLNAFGSSFSIYQHLL